MRDGKRGGGGGAEAETLRGSKIGACFASLYVCEGTETETEGWNSLVLACGYLLSH